MDEKDPSMDLPPEIACIHRKWNVRLVAYRALITHFQKLHPSSDEWVIYKNVIPNIAAETFPAIREQALETVFHFVQKCNTARLISSEVIHSLLDSIPNNIKPRAKYLLEKIILQFVEIGCSRDVIDELLRTALISQVPNVAIICIEIITKIISVFSPTAIDLAYVLETLPYLQEAEELEFRSATKALILEIYCWQGKESIKNVGQILNPSDLKDVVKKYEDAKQAGQLKPSRPVRNNKNRENGSRRSDNTSSDHETDLLRQINDEFFRKLESPEWNERRDALMELRKLLEDSFRLKPGNYEPLLTALKKVITEDQCVIVVGLAISSITGIAKGLRQQFSPYTIGICRILLEKFVEKRQNITEQLRKALDVLTTTTSFESLIKTINSCLGNKNPTIRFETIQLLSRMFKNSNRHTLRKPEFVVLYKSLVDCLHHGQLIIREKSFIALAIAFKIAGEGVIMPYLENIDPGVRLRIKNYNLDHDFEEKYNEIKYRNVAKKELKIEDKLIRNEISSDSNVKENEKSQKEINKFVYPSRGNFKTENQNAFKRRVIKSKRRKDSQPVLNYKRWSSLNPNIGLEKLYENNESENYIISTADVTSPHKEHRKKENLKKYSYRKPYALQRKDTSLILSKDKRKKRRIFSYKKKEILDECPKEAVFDSSDLTGDNIIMSMTNLSNNPIKLQPEVANNKPSQEYKKENPKKNDKTIKSTNIYFNALATSQDVPTSSKETVKMDAMTPSVSLKENSDVSQPVQQSVQTLDSTKCGEGFIVLTENEVKKLLGLKRISTFSDDSCSVLNDWTSKKSLFKRSYKIFQVSKGATDRETQTSLTAVESISEIAPEGGVIDLTKTVDVIPTQTAFVKIEEKGTDPRHIKKYNRGTQYIKLAQADILDTSSDWQGSKQQKTQPDNKGKETPLKMQSVVMKKIEYRRSGDRHPLEVDRSSRRTMQINTFTVARSDPVDISKNTTESLTSEVTTSAKETNETKPSQERNQSLPVKDKKQKQVISKSNNSRDSMLKNSTNSKPIKKVKRKYTHDIGVATTKESINCTHNDHSCQTITRLKKTERTKHHSLAKGKPKRNASQTPLFMSYMSHKSDLSICSHHKGRRSTFKKKKSKFIYENNNDTSSGSCREGCNFLPLVAKSIMGHQDEQKEKKNNNASRQHNKHNHHKYNKVQRNTKRGSRSNHNDTEQKKSEHALKKRSSHRCYSAGSKGSQNLNCVTDARDMDPQTKQMVIKELLKVCDISQATFDKMIRHKVSPTRPCLFAPKLPVQKSTDHSSPVEQETTEDHSVKEHRACTII